MNFVPKTAVEEYLNNSFNSEIYWTLTDHGMWYGIFEPLAFFNLLYERFEIAKDNRAKPLQVINEISELELTDRQRYFLLKKLDQLIFDYKYNLRFDLMEYTPFGGRDTPKSTLENLSQHLLREYVKLGVKLGITDQKPNKESIELNSQKNNTDLLVPNEDKTKLFTLGEKHNRADLVRILNVMYELGFIEDPTGKTPTKALFMKEAGNFFGVDFSRFDNDLSRALSQSYEANEEIFNRMKNKITNLKTLKENKKDKR